MRLLLRLLLLLPQLQGDQRLKLQLVRQQR